MGSSVVGISSPKNLTQSNVDANASSDSNSFNIGLSKTVVVQILNNTGTHASHIIQLQCSLDGANWDDVSGATVTGLGIITVSALGAKFIRVRVSTVEGAASTVDIKMQAK